MSYIQALEERRQGTPSANEIRARGGGEQVISS